MNKAHEKKNNSANQDEGRFYTKKKYDAVKCRENQKQPGSPAYLLSLYKLYKINTSNVRTLYEV